MDLAQGRPVGVRRDARWSWSTRGWRISLDDPVDAPHGQRRRARPTAPTSEERQEDDPPAGEVGLVEGERVDRPRRPAGSSWSGKLRKARRTFCWRSRRTSSATWGPKRARISASRSGSSARKSIAVNSTVSRKASASGASSLGAPCGCACDRGRRWPPGCGPSADPVDGRLGQPDLLGLDPEPAGQPVAEPRARPARASTPAGRAGSRGGCSPGAGWPSPGRASG